MLALIVGSGLAALGLLFVLLPLMRGAGYTGSAAAAPPAEEASAVEALREIEFDQATGKLSPDDYASLRATYAPLALAELEARDAGAAGTEASGVAAREIGAGVIASGDAGSGDASSGDAAEQLIARMKSRRLVCTHCGPRPEGDAIFCSDCGRYLSPACLRCGADVEDPHSRFCGECGSSLAA
ncbi:MAG: zinc ribbon domain-containing protein [Gemmatimonadetes bacterium]|nr:zinc ribbon domain-containing protein [Gemmatimonadota bacterium]